MLLHSYQCVSHLLKLRQAVFILLGMLDKLVQVFDLMGRVKRVIESRLLLEDRSRSDVSGHQLFQ